MRTALLLSFLFLTVPALADTPPPGTVKAKLFSGDGITSIDATGSSIDVDVTGSALPANACKETGGNLAAILSALQGTIDISGPVVIASPLPAGTNNIGTVNVNGTIPISGSIMANQGVPGPTASPWPVVVPSPVAVTGTFWQATQPISGTVTANAGSGTFAVSAASLPLPSGAATAAKQPALGTAGSASTDVISVQGISSMTPLKVDGSGVTQPVSGTFWQATQPVSGTFWQTTQPISGTVTANAGTGTFTVDASGHTVPVSGTFWQATQPVSGTFWQATQPISGSVTANIGTTNGLALDSTVSGLQVAQGSTTSGQSGGLFLAAVTTGSPTYTTGKSNPFSLTTAGALRIDGSATTQPVSGTFWQTTQPVSLATLPALTAGAAIIGKVGIDQTTPGTTNGVQVNAALPAGTNLLGKVGIDQTTPGTTNLVALAANQSVNVAQINGVTPLMGNGTTGTGSQRVTIASDNTAFSVNAIAKTPTAVTVKQAAITVGTSAVRLTNDGSAPAATRVLLVAQLISTSTANCYFGSSGVTTTSTTRGVQMFPAQVFSWSSDAGDYYAICDTSSQTFFVTEQE